MSLQKERRPGGESGASEQRAVSETANREKDKPGPANGHGGLEMPSSLAGKLGRYQNLPAELRALRIWACAAADKRPWQPNGKPAAVDAPSTWVSFDEAFAGVANGRFPHLGFMLDGQHTVIDLDNKLSNPATPEQLARHDKIREAFKTYWERSLSGTGYHGIMRGSFDGKGLNRDHVEVYCRAHFIVCTGDVVSAAPLADCQELVARLVGEMRPEATPAPAALEEHDEVMSDRDLVEMASQAENGAKFVALCNGEWSPLGYGSESQADHALLTMLCFYTQSNEQVRRLFRYSGLADPSRRTKPEKAERIHRDDKYLDNSISKIRAEQPAPVDLSALAARVEAVKETVAEPKFSSGLPPPPGLVGDIARYIYASSYKQVPEVALAAALGFTAGIVGRQFNTISDAQLNLYIVTLAETGTGKEGGKDGVERLVDAVRGAGYPTIDGFMGPAQFASGQALVRRLDEQPCMVSFIGEFGKLLRRLTNPKASPAEQSLVSALLDLYSRRMLRESAYSDRDNNTAIVRAPAFTLVGDSTPATFFRCLSEATIEDGFLPRFLVLEYAGERQPSNRNHGRPPPRELVDRLGTLVAAVEQMKGTDTTCRVELSPGAASVLQAFDARVDKLINDGKQEAVRQAWNRAHLNALKVSALLAVGVNTSTVTEEQAHWAVALVESSAHTILSRFESGEVGGSDEAQAEAIVRKRVVAFLKMSPAERRKARAAKAFETGDFIPHSYLNEVTKRDAAFHRKDMLADVLKLLVKSGDLVKLPDQQCEQQFKGWKGTEVYTLGPSWDGRG